MGREELRAADARTPRASLRAPGPPNDSGGSRRGSRGRAAYRAVRAAQRHHQLRLVLVRLLRHLKSLLHRKLLLLRCHGARMGTAGEWLWLAVRVGLSFPQTGLRGSKGGALTARVFKQLSREDEMSRDFRRRRCWTAETWLSPT